MLALKLQSHGIIFCLDYICLVVIRHEWDTKVYIKKTHEKVSHLHCCLHPCQGSGG